MEGVPVKFISASIASTPNGNEATINLHSVASIFDLKPKTAVQIFFREWWKDDAKWRLLFDGFTSRFDKRDDVQQGAGVAVTCRDFRMDIRKAPAAIVFGGESGLEQLGTYATLNGGGLYLNYCYPGTQGSKTNIKTYDNTQLADLYNIIRMVAGTAQSIGETKITVASKTAGAAAAQLKEGQKKGINTDKSVNTSLESSIKKANTEADATAETTATISDTEMSQSKVRYNSLFSGQDEGNWFMDALIKGMWIEAVAGTYVGQYLNKRLKTDKRFCAMKNEAGYRLFMQQQMSEFGAGYIAGGARFTSIEAMIMRIAGLFMYRPASLSSPPLIDLEDEKQREFFCSPRVYKNYCSKTDMFGTPYMAPFALLTPPLEFTAPPNCNVFLPAMYNGVSWQHDDDAEITRGYFNILDTFGSSESQKSVWSYQIQVPNTLLNYGNGILDASTADVITQAKASNTTDYAAAATASAAAKKAAAIAAKAKAAAAKKAGKALDPTKKTDPVASYAKAAPGLSLEERYKGVNIAEGTVSDFMARNDLSTHIAHAVVNAKAAIDIDKKILEAMQKASQVTLSSPATTNQQDVLNLVAKPAALAYASSLVDIAKGIEEYMSAALALVSSDTNAAEQKASLTRVLEQHATVKFINQKFAGRVAQITMDLNPFPICGFPGVLVADARTDSGERFGFQTRKSIVGTVQQVQHTIHASGQAQTSIVMNNARYADEPTYMSRDGLPTRMRATLPERAEIDTESMTYKTFKDYEYFVGNDKPEYDYIRQSDINTSEGVDIKMPETKETGYIYAKDFTTVSLEGLRNGQSNLSYIDQVYAPNLVSRFYVHCLRQPAKQSLMVGQYSDILGTTHWYAYDSVHEAVTMLEKRTDIVYDYQHAMEYIERDIVSFLGFYVGVLDMAYVDETWTNNRTRDFLDANSGKIDMSLLSGVGYDTWQTMASNARSNGDPGNAIVVQYGDNIPETPDGHYALEIEHMPATAFTRERHSAVVAYKSDIDGYAQAARYAYD